MIDYLYDGTFDGLLTVIYHHYYSDRASGIFTPERYQTSLLQDFKEVKTDPAKADKVYNAVRYKISEYDLRGVYRVWLSCDPEKEMKILRYLVLGFRQGHRTSSLHSDPVVADFQDILRKIGRESERMLQFVRFSVVQMAPEAPIGLEVAEAELAPYTSRDVLYARVEPDHDVIELVAPHFSDRFRNDRVIIHDVGRDKAVIAYHGHWLITAFAPEDTPAPTAEETLFRSLWKQYFDHIAIMERKNTRCQNNFVPDRYRAHLTEFFTAG